MASKQEQVVDLVREGKYTRQEIKDMVDCTAGALASYFSGMRNAAKFVEGSVMCPIEVDVEGKKVMQVTTFAEAEAAKAERVAAGPRASAKTPQERFDAAEKRVERCTQALEKAQERFEAAEGNRELELRFQKAEIEAELADIEFKRAKDNLASADDVESDDELEEEDELM